MATARQRSEWLRVGWLIFKVRAAVWGKEGLDLLKDCIPEPFRPPPPPPREMTEEERAAESEIGWAALDRAFGAMAGN